MISEPKGDLRHTCHVGADGRNFGLLNINKTDLSISSTISPSLRSISPIKEVKSDENIDLEDVDNCSNSTTLWDCSETKELLSQDKNNNRSPSKLDVINTKEYHLSPQKSFVTTMEPAEFEKRALNERRRTFKQLEKIEIAENSALRQSLRKIEKKDDKKYLFGDLTKSKKEPLPNFSVEAQQAYKAIF
uniref:CRIB domain-containing protein n=1 Tax=Meloidogyne javanica TaxID=6303 RepID=A0A915LVB0_MELJA